MPSVPSIRLSAVTSPEAEVEAEDYFALRPVRPTYRRHVSTQSVQSARSTLAPYRPTPTPAWEGSRTPHGMQIAPDAVDYFHHETSGQRSWRAMQNLALVATGRCLVSLGLAGISEAYVPGGLATGPDRTDAVAGIALSPHDFRFTVFVLGALGTVTGLLAHTIGVARFHHDTSKINRRRAHLVATAATVGAFLIAGGGAFYAYTLVQKDVAAGWGALPMRAVGNACLFFSIPASFSSSELVWGATPMRNRILWRDAFFASGGMTLIAWGQMSLGPNAAPLWARETTQCVGIVLTALGGALPRVDAMHAQALARMATPVSQEVPATTAAP